MKSPTSLKITPKIETKTKTKSPRMTEQAEPSKEVTTQDLLNFMTQFRGSMEDKIKKVESEIKGTNDKLDKRLNTMNNEMKAINVRINENDDEMNRKIDRNDKENKAAQNRMDERLSKLETEMSKSLALKEKRKKLEEVMSLSSQLAENRKEKEKEEKNKITREEERNRIQKQPQGRKASDHQPDQEKSMDGEQTGGNYRSLWASQLEKELEEAAKQAEQTKSPRWMEDEDRDREIPDTWDKLHEQVPKQKKVRKPIIIKKLVWRRFRKLYRQYRRRGK